ncbi:MAG: SIS domain-containing protein [Alphaproteobacteria bacterium]|nr:SIS domain-containing protein [Alphaproteobacteria bacterium]
MAESFKDYLQAAAQTINQAAQDPLAQAMEKAIALCCGALDQNQPLLVCGNGGSAADAMHFSAELVARFLKDRKGLPCICLASNPAMLTAWANDVDFETVFARQVEAFGQSGGVLIALSTSGKSKNIIRAAQQAKAMGLGVIALTGAGGGDLAALADVLLQAPSTHTPLIQQVHLCFYHYLCARIEERYAA